MLGFLFFLISCIKSYIVQTDDQTIHYIDKEKKSLKLPPIECSLAEVKNYIPQIQEFKENNMIFKGNKGFITKDGFIIYQNISIYINDLYKQPIFQSNILFSAFKQTDKINIDNNTIYISTIYISINDFDRKHNEKIKFSYIETVGVCKENVFFCGKFLYIDSRQYEFTSNITNVFKEIKVDDLTLLLSVVPSKKSKFKYYIKRSITFFKSFNLNFGKNRYKNVLKEYKYKNRYYYTFNMSSNRPKKRVFLIGIGILISTLVIFYKKMKHYKEKEKITETIRIGIYGNRDCLIARIDIDTYNLLKKYEEEKVEGIADIYFLKKYPFKNIVIFEDGRRYIDEIPDKKNVVGLIYDYIKGIENLHTKGILAENICPENMLISKRNKGVQIFLCKNRNFTSRNGIEGKEEDFSDNIFKMGCIIHMFLTGYHPFDFSNEEEKENYLDNFDKKNLFKALSKTMKNEYNLLIIRNILDGRFMIRTKDSITHDFIYHMIKGSFREVSKHPFFWTDGEICDFICDFSDYLEIHISEKNRVEKVKNIIFSDNWYDCLDESVKMQAREKRFYNYEKASDLIRFIRNVFRHSKQTNMEDFYDNIDGGVLGYFKSHFPGLIFAIYRVSLYFKNYEKIFKRFI